VESAPKISRSSQSEVFPVFFDRKASNLGAMSRVTLEEKRVRMLELFHESLDIFELKQLEAIAPKQKGIVASAVKSVLQVRYYSTFTNFRLVLTVKY